MKKLFAVALTAALTLCLCACGAEETKTEAETPSGETTVSTGGSEDKGEMATVKNPMVSYSSLEEINEKVGCALCRPGVMGVSDERFFVIEGSEYNIAEYCYTVAGVSYTMRSAATTQDISGCYEGGKTAFEGVEASSEIQYAEAAGRKLARWFNVDGQYVLSAPASDVGDDFVSTAQEVYALTLPLGVMTEAELEAFYAELAGQYFDEYSMRATLLAEADGSAGVKLTVSWANSASEFVCWTMTAHRSEDGLLSYSDCLTELVNTTEDGKETRSTLSEGVAGYFAVEEGKLAWTGAEDENCRNCVFAKFEETTAEVK